MEIIITIININSSNWCNNCPNNSNNNCPSNNNNFYYSNTETDTCYGNNNNNSYSYNIPPMVIPYNNSLKHMNGRVVHFQIDIMACTRYRL